jgi:hypothetical protein
MTAVEVLKKRRVVAKAQPSVQEVIRGSIVIMARHCGNATCRCQKGFKHRSLYISQRYRGKTRMIYVPKRSEAAVRRFINNYRKTKAVMDKISDANIKMLTKGLK